MTTPANLNNATKKELRQVSFGVNVITVGSGMDYLTIADAIAALSTGIPIDVTPAGTSASPEGNGVYCPITGLNDFSDNEFGNSPRWIECSNGNNVGNPHLISDLFTGGNASTSMITRFDEAIAGADVSYILSYMPTVIFRLSDDETHVINTDLQIPDNISFQLIADGKATISIQAGGVLRMPDVGAFIARNIDFRLNTLSTLAITNSATANKPYNSLIMDLGNSGLMVSTPSAPNVSGVLTAQVFEVKCATFRWVGNFSGVTPNPNTLILGRVTAGQYEVDINCPAEQSGTSRFIAFEFSNYEDRVRIQLLKTFRIRGANESINIHLSERTSTDDSYSVGSTGTHLSVDVIGVASIYLHALQNVKITGQNIAAGEMDGASGGTLMASKPMANPSGTTALSRIINARSFNFQISGGAGVAVKPTSAVFNYRLTASSVTITATPSIDASAIPIGESFYLMVDDIAGSNSLTLQDKSVLAGSGIVTKSGLAVAGNLVIPKYGMVEFINNGTYLLQVSDVLDFESNSL